MIEFFSNCCLVKNKVTRNTLLEGALKQGLYQLNLSKVPTNSPKALSLVSCFVHHCNAVNNVSDSNLVSNVHSNTNQSSSACNVSDLDIWHMRLGHPSVNTLKQVLALVTDNSNSIKQLSFCSTSKYGKMHQTNFPSSQTKTSHPFELVHSTVWGPSHTVSIVGYRYYLYFVDDFTRFTWIFPLKVKSDCLKLFF